MISFHFRILPRCLVGQIDVFDKVFSHFCSSGFSPLVPVILELRVVSRLSKDLDQFGLETQQVLRVVDARNLGGAVDLVHGVADLVVPEKNVETFFVENSTNSIIF